MERMSLSTRLFPLSLEAIHDRAASYCFHFSSKFIAHQHTFSLPSVGQMNLALTCLQHEVITVNFLSFHLNVFTSVINDLSRPREATATHCTASLAHSTRTEGLAYMQKPLFDASAHTEFRKPICLKYFVER
jgi:hypothetical protein